MNNASWQQARIPLLALVVLSTLAVLGKAIATPKVDQTAQAYTFPATVPLLDWQAATSEAIKGDGDTPGGQQYQYRRGANSLEIQTRVVPGDGNISRFLFVYTPIKAANAKLEVRNHPDTGFYGVMTHEGRAYLSACVNPRGTSTVTAQQFTQNLYDHSFKVTRLLPWLSGQEALLDQRCLWTLMSTSLPNGIDADSPDPKVAEQTFKNLETAWLSWYKWWQPNFPPAT